VSFEEGVGKILANINYWRNAPLWDPDSIATATKTWFEYLSPEH
jgi:UDP-glucose 4-epimerase